MMIDVLSSEAHKHCADTARYEMEISFNKFIGILPFFLTLPAFPWPVFLFPSKLYGSFLDVIFELTELTWTNLNFTEPRISVC